MQMLSVCVSQLINQLEVALAVLDTLQQQTDIYFIGTICDIVFSCLLACLVIFFF